MLQVEGRDWKSIDLSGRYKADCAGAIRLSEEIPWEDEFVNVG